MTPSIMKESEDFDSVKLKQEKADESQIDTLWNNRRQPEQSEAGSDPTILF